VGSRNNSGAQNQNGSSAAVSNARPGHDYATMRKANKQLIATNKENGGNSINNTDERSGIT